MGRPFQHAPHICGYTTPNSSATVFVISDDSAVALGGKLISRKRSWKNLWLCISTCDSEENVKKEKAREKERTRVTETEREVGVEELFPRPLLSSDELIVLPHNVSEFFS